jgi:hypothetical protein
VSEGSEDLEGGGEEVTEDRRKQLIDEIEGSEKLCGYCPLPEEVKGMHCYGGNPVGCEGSKCPDAIETYLDEMEEADSDA